MPWLVWVLVTPIIAQVIWILLCRLNLDDWVEDTKIGQIIGLPIRIATAPIWIPLIALSRLMWGYHSTFYDRHFLVDVPENMKVIEFCGRCGAIWDDDHIDQIQHSRWCRFMRFWNDRYEIKATVEPK